jgi:hypothetical protein
MPARTRKTEAVNTRRLTLKLLDTVAYAVTATAVAIVASGVPSLALGWGLVGVKFALFFVGFAMMGFATFKLRPTPPWKDDDPTMENDTEEVGLAAVVSGRIPEPYRLDPADRASVGTKLFVASIAILTTSYLLESALGVAL